MLSRDFRKNKIGQLSDAMTWIVATIVIVVILVIFFYASSVLAEIKDLEVDSKILFLDKQKTGEVGWIKEKTNFAFKLNKDNEEKINNWLEENEKS